MKEPQDDRASSRQIAAALRARIMDGTLRPGEALAPVRMLMEEFGTTSSGTIRNAQDVLKDEGFLVSLAGSGVFVRTQPLLVVAVAPYHEPSPGSWSYDLLKVGEEPAPAHVATVFGLAAGAPVIVRHRVTLLAGEPVDVHKSYYDLRLVAGTPLTETKKIKGGAPKVLNDLGHPQVRYTDRVSARLPTDDEMRWLRLPALIPIIRRCQTFYDPDGLAVEVSVIMTGGHRYELFYEAPVPASPQSGG